MIEVENLSFCHGKKEILKDVSLQFEPGRLYVVIGPNGTGKTTLLHCMARLHRGTGRILLDGKEHTAFERRAFSKKLALLPQEQSVPDMTVADLVAAGRYPYLDLSKKLTDADHAAVERAMRQTNTEQLAAKSMKKLSGGERRRAYIAMLMAQDTPYLLLDEPTAHLDIGYRFAVMELLTALRDEGKCVVAVLHDLSLAFHYADEIVLLHQGRAAVYPDAPTLTKSGALRSAFGVNYTGNTEFEVAK